MALIKSVNDMVELNVVVIWSLKKDGLLGLFDEIKRFPGTDSILYDHDCSVFTINCLAKDEEDIENCIQAWLEAIEDDIEENEVEKLAEYTGALLIPMPTNPWIARLLDAATEKDLEECYAKLRVPPSILKSQYSFVWTFPRTAVHYTVDDFLTSQLLAELTEDMDAVETDLFGTEIYFGSEHHQAGTDLQEKLDVLMYGKLLADPQGSHVFYTEGYRPRPGKQITLEARFLSSIDHNLIRTTLFDVGGSKDIAYGYHILSNGITIRVCRWDVVKGFDVSLLGPKMTPRKGSVAKPHPVAYVPPKIVVPGKHPLQSNKIKEEVDTALKFPSPTPEEAGVRFLTKPDNFDNHASLTQKNKVEEWLLNPEFEPNHGVTTSADIRTGREQEIKAFADLEGLIFAPDAPTTVVSDVREEHEAPEPSNGTFVAEDANAHTPPPMAGWGKQFASKKPVAPPSSQGTNRPASRASSTQTGHPGPPVAGSIVTTHAARTGRHTGIEVSEEIQAAVAKLVLKGPYLRGKLTLRFELGRIVITGMDVSGLAFNLPGTRSNGWVKSKMLINLNRAGGKSSVLFTPLLTQDGSDIQFMVKMTDLDARKPLWKQEANEAKIYSFFCCHRYNGTDDYFFIDVEAITKDKDPRVERDNSTDYIYSLRTENDDKGPIWIHGTMRNWDARIVMSHTDTCGLEEKYGAFAKHVASSMPLKHIASKPCFNISSWYNMKILGMRTKTLWRFSSSDDASVLNVTEVRQAPHKILACTKDNCNCTGLAHEFDLKTTVENVQASQPSRDLGMWYEAFITSTAAEQALAKNEVLKLGEMASWSYEHLNEKKAVEALFQPGLRMVQLMDSVGAHNDNQRMEDMRLPTSNHHADGTPSVPGAYYLDDEPPPSLSAMPENDMPDSDKFKRSADPPASVRGPTHLAVATEHRATPRRQIASYRLSSQPTTDHLEPEVAPAPVPAPQQQNNRADSRSSSNSSSRLPATYRQTSSLFPEQKFW